MRIRDFFNPMFHLRKLADFVNSKLDSAFQAPFEEEGRPEIPFFHEDNGTPVYVNSSASIFDTTNPYFKDITLHAAVNKPAGRAIVSAYDLQSDSGHVYEPGAIGVSFQYEEDYNQKLNYVIDLRDSLPRHRLLALDPKTAQTQRQMNRDEFDMIREVILSDESMAQECRTIRAFRTFADSLRSQLEE